MTGSATVILACLLALVPGAHGGDPEGPSRNDLVLRVERLEQAEQAGFTGSQDTVMLFDPGASAAIDAAEAGRAGGRDAVRAELFTGPGPAPALHAPHPTGDLFGAGSWGGAGARATAENAPGPVRSRSTAVAVGLAVLVCAAATASLVLRTREVIS